MERLRPPPPFDFDDENVKKNWKVWEKHFRYYLVATECDEKADKIKVAILLSCIGIRGREIYDKLGMYTPLVVWQKVFLQGKIVEAQATSYSFLSL